MKPKTFMPDGSKETQQYDHIATNALRESTHDNYLVMHQNIQTRYVSTNEALF